MKTIKIRYIYDWDFELLPMPYYRDIPSSRAWFTGRYRFVNGSMQVEVEEKHWFGLTTKTRFIGEDSFHFVETETFECQTT